MIIPTLFLKRIEPETYRKPFDCSDADLNEFFFEDSKGHSHQLLAVTYAFESDRETIAYFCVSNDSIRGSDSSKTVFRRILNRIPHRKRYKSHPAVKIGRFAVSNNHQKQGIGTELMDYIKAFFIINNKTGCRFITIDAYRAAIPFYQKNGFDFLTTTDENEDRRQMYFDLYPLSKVIGIDNSH